jgi:hypothetical protein
MSTGLNRTQLIGVILVAAAAFTYFGGPQVVLSLFGASFVGGSVTFIVRDGDTSKPIEGAVITLTGVTMSGVKYPLCLHIGPTDRDGVALAGISYDAEVSASGYRTEEVSFNVPQGPSTQVFTLEKGVDEPVNGTGTTPTPGPTDTPQPTSTPQPTVTPGPTSSQGANTTEPGNTVKDQVKAVLDQYRVVYAVVLGFTGVGLVMVGSAEEKRRK